MLQFNALLSNASLSKMRAVCTEQYFWAMLWDSPKETEILSRMTPELQFVTVQCIIVTMFDTVQCAPEYFICIVQWMYTHQSTMHSWQCNVHSQCNVHNVCTLISLQCNLDNATPSSIQPLPPSSYSSILWNWNHLRHHNEMRMANITKDIRIILDFSYFTTATTFWMFILYIWTEPTF